MLSGKHRNLENDIKPKTPNKYLSTGDHTKKLKTVTAQKCSSESKLKQMREKFEKESVFTNKEDSGDMDEVFSYVDCNIDLKKNENMRLLWECKDNHLNVKT